MNINVNIKRIVYRFSPLEKYIEKNRETDTFVFYIKGGHRFDFGNYTIEATEGNMLYIPHGSCYVNHTLTNDTQYFEIDFLLSKEGDKKPLFNEPRSFSKKESSPFLSVFREIYDVFSKRNDNYDLICITHLLKIMDMILKNDKTHNRNTETKKIEKTINYINEYYFENTSISELAKISDMSVSNLEKLFKKHLGITPIRYRHFIRCEQAKLLLAGGLSATRVSEKLGYIDTYHFCKMFKKICAITPGGYAKRNSKI